MTDHEWRAVADELERLADDFDGARPEFRDTTAGALVDRVRAVIREIRAAFLGN